VKPDKALIAFIGVIGVKKSTCVGIPLQNFGEMWLSSDLLCLRGHESDPM